MHFKWFTIGLIVGVITGSLATSYAYQGTIQRATDAVSQADDSIKKTKHDIHEMAIAVDDILQKLE